MPFALDPLQDGTYKLCVLAKDIKGNGGNIGSLPAQGANCINFKIKRPPQVSMLCNGAQLVFTNAAGTSNSANGVSHGPECTTEIAGNVSRLTVASEGTGTIEVLEPAGADPSALPAGTTRVRARIKDLPPGSHTFSAFSPNGSETRLSWAVESMGLGLSPNSSSVFDPGNGTFSGNLILNLTSTRELLRAEALKPELADPLNTTLHAAAPLTGLAAAQNFTLDTLPPFATPPGAVTLTMVPGKPDTRDATQAAYQLYVRDRDGGVMVGVVSAGQGGWAGSFTSTADFKPYPWSPAPTLGNQESPLYDLLEGHSKLLPGAVIPVGWVRDLDDGIERRHVPVDVRLREAAPISGSLPEGPQIIGRVTLTLRTGDAPESLGSSVTLIEADVKASPENPLEILQLAQGYNPVRRFFKLAVTFNKVAPTTRNNCLRFSAEPPIVCLEARNFEAEVASAGEPLIGQIVLTTGVPAGGIPVAIGNAQSVPANFGVTASALDVTSWGFLVMAQTGGSPDRGFRGLPRDGALMVASHPGAPLIASPFQVKATYDAAGLTPAQEERGRVVRVSHEGVRTKVTAEVDTVGHAMTFTLPPPERISLEQAQANPPDLLGLESPDYENPALVELPGLELGGNSAGVSAAPGSVPGAAVAALQAQGMHLAGPAFELGPHDTALDPPAVLKLDFNPEASLALGFPLEDLFIARIAPDGSFEALGSPSTDRVNSFVTAELPRIGSLYAVLASSPVAPPEQEPPPPPPPPTVDIVPPVTTVQVGVSSFTDTAGTIFVSTSAFVGFTAEDPSPGSGLARIDTALDGGSFATFTSPFTLTAGTHTLQYRAADLAGNLESARSLPLTSDGQAPSTSLQVNGVAAAEGALSLSATDQLSLASTDTASGVAGVRFSTDGAPMADFADAFVLGPGTHTLSFSAVDRVGNAEPLRSVSVTVRAVPSFEITPFLAGGRLLGACAGVDLKGTARLEGDIAANGLISLAGNSTLAGNATAGTLRSVGKSSVTGNVTAGTVNCLPVDLAPLLETIQATALPAPPAFNKEGALVVTGHQTLSLASGTYLLSGLTVTGGAVLETAGRVNLFVRGQISVEGRSIVNRGPTTDLVIFSDSALPVRLAGGAFLRAILYAPNASLSVAGGATARGHFQAREAAITGAALAVANPHLNLSPPTNLRAVARSDTSISLEWDDFSNPPGQIYSVEWATGNLTCADAGAPPGGFAELASTTSITLNGLSPGTTHLFHVHTDVPDNGVTGPSPNKVILATLPPGQGLQSVGPADYTSCEEGPPPSGGAMSAVTFPAYGSVVTSLLTISGTAASPAGIADVAVSVQRAADGFYWNGAAYGPGQVFVPASGTENWTLNSPFAIHSGTGVFIIESRARDLNGQFQNEFPEGVSRITVTRRLNGLTEFRATARSSTTLALAWNPSGNPEGTLYAVHFDTGDCLTADFRGGDRFSPTSQSTTPTLAGLEPSTAYNLHIHIYDADGRDQTGSGPIGSGSITAQTREPGQGLDSSGTLFAFCEGGGGGGGGTTGDGKALAVGPDGSLWEVARLNAGFVLAKHDSGARLLASVELPGAMEDGNWSIHFDGAGNATAVGTSLPPGIPPPRSRSIGQILPARPCFPARLGPPRPAPTPSPLTPPAIFSSRARS